MAFTESDLDKIKDAIIALATGERVVQVTVDGRTTQYAQADLDKLKSLRSEIQSELGTAGPRPIRVSPRRMH